jgi:4-amino-4-deoxy-L-arabinose transferase-like glycosyltransferase
MNLLPQTATPDAPAPPSRTLDGSERRPLRLALDEHARLLGLLAVVFVSAVLNIHRLSQNGYANIFYSAGIKSMLRSWHNFVFVAFDPGGLVSVDKPPLALWLQAASAKLFGFTPLSLLLPGALAGVLAVAALYLILARRLSVAAAIAGGLTMAVFPSFVAVSRDNGVDPLLILLMVLACGSALRACETGSWRWLLWCGVLIGLAFNTKTLAAFLIVPPIALAYLVCTSGPPLRRIGQILLAGALMLLVAFSWIAFVELTPASKRPYVGSSTNNTELGLTFEYNGVGRVEGQEGGPGRVPVKAGGKVLGSHQLTGTIHHALPPAPGATTTSTSTAVPVHGREANPIPFGGPPAPLRLFGHGLGDQAAWMLPYAFFGLLALMLLVFLERPAPGGQEREDELSRLRGRRDPRLASAIVLGGWFVVEFVVLSLSKGIVHPYYVSALAPGTGAMAGAGAVSFVALARLGRRGRVPGIVLAALALAGTVAAQIVLMNREHYLLWFIPVLIAGVALSIIALLALRRLAAPAVALSFALLLVAPAAYASTTWLAPVQGTFAAAGPHQAAGHGGDDVSKRTLAIDDAMLSYVRAHRPGTRWPLLSDAATTAAPFILNGLDAGALGGYSGTDPTLDGPGLARLVARGEARWVVLGGEYSLRGGNKATVAVQQACRQLKPSEWSSPVPTPDGLVLFDCAGRERQLAAS